MLAEIVFYNNSLADWLLAGGVAVFILAIALLTRRVSRQRLAALASGTVAAWDDLLAELIGRLNGLFFLAVAGYFGSLKLSLPDPAGMVFGHAVTSSC